MSAIRASTCLRSYEEGNCRCLYKYIDIIYQRRRIIWIDLSCQVHFLFGGNPGRSCLPNLRLDDFWQLELRRPTPEQVLKRCKLIIRTHKFKELALSNSIEALEYLQTRVFEIIDHDDVQQTKEVTRCIFRLLTHACFP